MYFAQVTKERIKALCKHRKVSMEDVLSNCSLGVNAIRQINDTKGMASFSLAKIADYLDCSVDYLLGRTDDPTFVPRKAIKEFPHTKKRPSDAYIAAFGGNVHVPEDEKTPRVAREIFEEARNEEEE